MTGGESHSGKKIPWPETAVRVRVPPEAPERPCKLLIIKHPTGSFLSPSPKLVTVWSRYLDLETIIRRQSDGDSRRTPWNAIQGGREWRPSLRTTGLSVFYIYLSHNDITIFIMRSYFPGQSLRIPALLIALLCVLQSCSVTSKVNLANDYYSAYGGKSYSYIVSAWGAPNRVVSDGQDGTILIYENFTHSTNGSIYNNGSNLSNVHANTLDTRHYVEF